MNRLPSEKGTGVVIATVRIAPTEQWCPESLTATERNGYNASAIIGMQILIFPHTMREWNAVDADHFNPRACSGKYWDVEPASGAELTHRFNGKPVECGVVICEHMLEMD